MIDRAQLVELFATMKDNGLNAEDALLWGYFFRDADPEQLQTLVPALETRGYKFVDLFEAETEDFTPDTPVYYLHVEKIEKHTIDTLDARNKEMYALADQYGIAKYDGMDVGPPIEAPPSFSAELN